MNLNHTEDTTGATPEGPQELDALGRIEIEAAGDEQARADAEEKILNPEPEPVIDPAQAWGQVAMMVGGILSMALPELKTVYSEPACMAWGGGMAAVAEKYGWEADETIAKFAPECALALASFPLIVGTVQAIKSRQEASKAKPLNAAPMRPGDGVAGPNNADVVEVKPMDMAPGGFSEPT